MFRKIAQPETVNALLAKFRDLASPTAFIDPVYAKVAIETEPANFPGRPPRELYGDANTEPDYTSIAKNYGLEFKGGGERIAVLVNPPSLDDKPFFDMGANLKLAGVTSVDIAAAKKGKILGTDGKPVTNPFYDLAVIGGVVTADDKLILGTRGRRFGKELTADRVMTMADNCYALAPGGGATFRFEGNPLEYTLFHEAQEELALTRSEINGYGLDGLFLAKQIGPIGLKAVYRVRTTLDSTEILDRHERGLARYTELCTAGKKQDEVADQLVKEGLAPDVWEHSKLEALSLDETLDRLGKMTPNMQNPLENKACGIGVGAILTLLKSDILWNQVP
mgnify:CR=1 FL=1